MKLLRRAGVPPGQASSAATATRRRGPCRSFNAPAHAGLFARREAIELRRDPIRRFAFLGSVLWIVIGYGIIFDVEKLTFAVLDRDRHQDRRSVLTFAGSRYFTEKPPIINYADLDRRMRSGSCALRSSSSLGFGRDLLAGRRP